MEKGRGGVSGHIISKGRGGAAVSRWPVRQQEGRMLRCSYRGTTGHSLLDVREGQEGAVHTAEGGGPLKEGGGTGRTCSTSEKGRKSRSAGTSTPRSALILSRSCSLLKVSMPLLGVVGGM